MLQLLVFMIITSSQIIFSQIENKTSWEYFGQNSPGINPEIFAPGIISGKGRMHCFPTISSNNKEIYWMTLPPKIQFSKYEDKIWSNPEEPLFSKNILCLRPFISYDNQKIYFASNLPNGYGNLDIWFIEKSDSGFSKPKNIGLPVNTNKYEAQQTFTNNGTIYYTGYVENKKWNRGIMRSKYINGEYQKPEILGNTINIPDTNAIDYTPFIAKDESYLLFCSNRQNLTDEKCQIYICFRDSKDNWSNPVNISQAIGFDFNSKDPSISPDGKYLFFSSGENIYWLSTKIINNLKVQSTN